MLSQNRTPGSNQFSTTSLNERLRIRPAQIENISALAFDSAIGISATALHQRVSQKTDEHGRVEVRRVYHAYVSRLVVEVLLGRREGRQERGQVVVVKKSLVPGGIGELGLGQTGSQGRRGQVVERMPVDLELETRGVNHKHLK